MEILAPAGTKESFIAAINAGANAIYVGSKKFNARLNASNLNFYDLEVLIDYAHKKNVKVFIVFNTLIKHEEINEAVNTIGLIEKINPDGIIVQDLGIARIITEYFPGLRLHASTQLAVHNSIGVDVLANMGFKRVVLARELTFSEIKSISNHQKAELEIFVHGALCFSVSGMCFFSSLIGGYSGNRGLCTQPCRRLWNSNNTKGYLFSPKDLELAEFIQKIKSTKVKSLKIEGRMRSSEYVYKTVKAYRMLIDSKPEDFEYTLKEAKILLDNDFARKKSTCLFSGRDEMLFEPKKAQCMGKKIGTIISIFENKIKFVSNEEIFIGDRLRVSNPENDNTIVFKITDLKKENNIYTFKQLLDGFSPNNPVFKASSYLWDEKIIKKNLDEIYETYCKKTNMQKNLEQQKNTYTSLISRLWEKDTNDINYLWVKIDNSLWLSILNNIKQINFFVIAITKNNFNSFKNYFENENIDKEIAIELFPFISQREIQDYKNIIKYFISKGITKFILNNIAQIELFENSFNIQKIAGNYLYIWNGYSGRALKENGFEYFFTSYEDDFLNIRRLANSGLSSRLLLPIFGYPLITISRMLPKETNYDIAISDKNNIALKQTIVSGMNVLITKEPFMIFSSIEKLKATGIKNFVIDLNFIEPSQNYFSNLIKHLIKNTNFDKSIKFNFKRGIK